GADHVLRVEAVHARDDHAVHLLLGDDLLELIGTGEDHVREGGDAVAVELPPGRVDVQQRHELGDVGVGACDRVEVHLGSVAGADQGVAGGHVSPVSSGTCVGVGGGGGIG